MWYLVPRSALSHIAVALLVAGIRSLLYAHLCRPSTTFELGHTFRSFGLRSCSPSWPTTRAWTRTIMTASRIKREAEQRCSPCLVFRLLCFHPMQTLIPCKPNTQNAASTSPFWLRSKLSIALWVLFLPIAGTGSAASWALTRFYVKGVAIKFRFVRSRSITNAWVQEALSCGLVSCTT
jgi:hypothetical protein